MKKSLIRGMACFLVLALTALFGVGCGGGGEEGKVTILVGEIIDLTGPGSPAVKLFTMQHRTWPGTIMIKA
jgi:hypothetical protein